VDKLPIDSGAYINGDACWTQSWSGFRVPGRQTKAETRHCGYLCVKCCQVKDYPWVLHWLNSIMGALDTVSEGWLKMNGILTPSSASSVRLSKLVKINDTQFTHCWERRGGNISWSTLDHVEGHVLDCVSSWCNKILRKGCLSNSTSHDVIEYTEIILLFKRVFKNWDFLNWQHHSCRNLDVNRAIRCSTSSLMISHKKENIPGINLMKASWMIIN
jgi:hypothetical protein